MKVKKVKKLSKKDFRKTTCRNIICILKISFVFSPD